MIKNALKGCKRTLSTALNLYYIKKTGSQIKYEKSVVLNKYCMWLKKDLRTSISVFKWLVLAYFLLLWLDHKLANSLINPFILDMDMYVLQK